MCTVVKSFTVVAFRKLSLCAGANTSARINFMRSYTLLNTPAGDILLDDVKLADKKLTYSFAPGPQIFCTLELQEDGGYEGPCADAGGEEGTMTMKKKEEDN